MIIESQASVSLAIEFTHLYSMSMLVCLFVPLLLRNYKTNWGEPSGRVLHDHNHRLVESFGSICRKTYSSYIKFKETVHQFWIYNIFLVPQQKKHFCKRSILIKQLWLEIIEKILCLKAVRVIYIIYITVLGRTDFEHNFSQLFRVVLTRWTFHKKCFYCWDRKNCYIFKIGEQSLKNIQL